MILRHAGNKKSAKTQRVPASAPGHGEHVSGHDDRDVAIKIYINFKE